MILDRRVGSHLDASSSAALYAKPPDGTSALAPHPTNPIQKATCSYYLIPSESVAEHLSYPWVGGRGVKKWRSVETAIGRLAGKGGMFSSVL